MSGDAFKLDANESLVLTEMDRACKDKKTADRIKIILMLNHGFTDLQIKEILLTRRKSYKSVERIFCFLQKMFRPL
jgi:hypothetical protein